MKQIGDAITTILIVVFTVILSVLIANQLPFEFRGAIIIFGILIGLLFANYYFKGKYPDRQPFIKNKSILLFGGGITAIMLISGYNTFEKNKIEKAKFEEQKKIYDGFNSTNDQLEKLEREIDANIWTENDLVQLREMLMTEENINFVKNYEIKIEDFIECYILKLTTRFSKKEMEIQDEKMQEVASGLAKECLKELSK